MSKLKVTYLVSTLGRTGPTQQLLNLISRLDRQKFNPQVITISSESSDSRIFEFKQLSVPVVSLNQTRLASILVGHHHLRRMLNEQNPDIIHSQGIRADFLNACVRRPAVRITTQRNDPLKDYPMLYGRLAGFTLAYVHYAVLRNLPVVVNCSYSLEISNKSRQLNSSTIQNGIDSDGSYLASDEEKKSIRYQLRLPQDALLFVSAGPLIPRKNPIELISTFREILDKHLGPRPLHLVILGDGPLVYKARETINSIDGIELRGQVNNVGDYMKAADCFLSASLSEGLPNAVIEALSWGTPIIISDIPAHREIHQLDKEIGSLFPLENRELLMRTILGFRPSSSACRAARAIVVNHFNADKMANRYQELYRTAAGAL